MLAVVVAVTTAAGSTQKRSATTITIWWQGDWPEIVKAATDRFKAKHAGVDVKLEPQTWADHLTKFDAALAGGNAPDVIELGNTEMTKYMAAGAFADITSAKSQFDNNTTWLASLRASGTYGGKFYGVPYYAGARGIIYRKDLYKQAGVKVPTSLDEFLAGGKKLMNKFGKKDPNFSALYMPGKYWYAAMSFVYDYGGRIAATKGGKWRGTLDSPQAIQGLTKWKDVTLALSRADKSGDTDKPAQDSVFAQGHVAALVANGWEWGVITDPKSGNPKLDKVLGAYPVPSHVKGQVMPTFLGGSNLAIPATSKNRQLAIDWLKEFTSTESETAMAKLGVIANTTTLLSVNKSNPKLGPFAAAAAKSWFVPTAPNWVNVENADVLQNMLVQIYTGKKSVKAAAASADKQIAKILNES